MEFESDSRKEGGQMRIWKKALIGGVSALTLSAGVGAAALASSNDSPQAKDRVARQVDVRKEDHRAQDETQPADDHGIGEKEARGGEAEGEREPAEDRDELEANDDHGLNSESEDQSGRQDSGRDQTGGDR